MADSFCEALFPAVGGKEVACRFDGGDLTSDAGLLLLREADRKVGLTDRMAAAIRDGRQQSKVVHTIQEMLQERVYAIAAGYEDADDLDDLGKDPALKASCERLPESDGPLASQPTISRLENAVSRSELLRMGVRIAERVIASLPPDTKKVILDVDATEDPCHGQQELEFFNGHYGGHCYLPLYFHLTADDGRQRLLGALLRPGNSKPIGGALAGLRIAVRLLRARFPEVAMVVRGDSAFGIRAVIQFCEKVGLDYVLGLNRNKALDRLSTPVQMDTALKYKWEGNGCREYGEFGYAANTWDGERRVIVRSQVTLHELNARFVVTSLKGLTPEELYGLYCGRGNQENRIKEMKLDLSSGRTSCHRFFANQCRLLLHTAACVLMSALQDALKGTRWASAQIGTIRLRLLKVGARVVETCRKIWFHLPSSYTEKDIWRHIHSRLTDGVG